MGLFLSYKATINVVYYKKTSPLSPEKKMRCAIRKNFTSGINTRIFANNCPFGRKLAIFVFIRISASYIKICIVKWS